MTSRQGSGFPDLPGLPAHGLGRQRDGTAIPTEYRASLLPARSWAMNTSSGMEEAHTATSIQKGIRWVGDASLPLPHQQVGTRPPLSC